MDGIIRKHKRLSRRFPIKFGTESPRYLGFARDISLGGLCLSSKTMFHEYSELVMEFQKDAKPVTVRGSVRWVAEPDQMGGMTGMKSDMGIELTEAGEDYKEFVVSAFEKAQNIRADTRYGKTLKIIFETRKELVQKYTQDISQGGIYVKSDDAPPFDSEQKIKLIISENMLMIDAVGKVVHIVTPEMAEQHGLNPGFGIQFIRFEDDGQKKLTEYISSLKNRERYLDK